MSETVVKSVKRLFDIFELFREAGKPMEAIEVSRALGLPLTSTHALLNSMRTLDYLDYDKSKRAFFPSRKLPKLFEWLSDRVEDEGQLSDFLKQLNVETKETIGLICQAGANAKIIYGHESIHPIGVRINEGLILPIAQTAAGLCILAGLSADELQELRSTLMTKSPDQLALLDTRDIAEKLKSIRKDGYLIGFDLQVGGIGAVCMPIVSKVSKKRLIVSIVGPTERIREDAANHLKSLKKLSRQYNIDRLFPEKSKMAHKKRR